MRMDRNFVRQPWAPRMHVHGALVFADVWVNRAAAPPQTTPKRSPKLGSVLATHPVSAAQILATCCLVLLACGGQTRRDELAPAPSAVLLPAPLHGFDPRAFRSTRALSVQRGVASFYAERFSGRTTANGEQYDPRAYTAAHRTLPLGSIVRVVLARSGYWVLVRINDRGPYASRQRIIDLSRQAARRLSIVQAGLARVRLEVLELGRGRRHFRASHVAAQASLAAAPADG
jgi:rare lipoprotein A